MAKIRLTSPTFDASAQTVVHGSFSDVTLAGIQMIINVTDNIIIYNFADPAKGGSLSTDTLTLDYDTTTMSDTDELMVLVEDGTTTQAISHAALTELGAAINASSQMDVNIAANGIGLATAAKQDTIIGHVDGIEGILTTIDADTGNISTKIDTIAGAVSGSEMQVDIVTLPGDVEADIDQIRDQIDLITPDIEEIRVDADAIRVATEIMDDWDESDRAKVNIIVGQAGITAGAGSVAANTPRVTHASDDPVTTSLQLIDDVVYTDDTSTHSTGTSKGVLIMGAATPSDTAVNANDIGAVGMTNNRELYVSLRDIAGATAVTGSGNATGALRVELANNGTGVLATVGAVTAITNALPAGTNAIGKLAANSGVDIGDVDVTSVVPGTTASSLGKAEDAAHASGDTGVAVWGVRNDNAGTTFGADQDYGPLATDLKGRVLVRQVAPTATLTNVASSASNVTLLAANSARIGATLYNDSTQSVYVKFGATASSSSFTVILATNTYYEVPGGYTGIIDGIWSSANGNMRVTELT